MFIAIHEIKKSTIVFIFVAFNQQVVGNSLKSLEVSEEKANQRVEEFKRQLKSLTIKLKEAENRAELAEKTVKKLQKEVDRLEGKSFWIISRLIFYFSIDAKIMSNQENSNFYCLKIGITC